MFAIKTAGLTKAYGHFSAVNSVDLHVPIGSVYALMGASGAGKTTTIKILLNMLEASSGSATVLGVDSQVLGPELLSQIGYVSESQSLPKRLRVAQFFDYLRPCYPTWDPMVERELRDQLHLPPERRIGELSHGMRLKLALACGLAFKPRLLILDEPLSGLDALARDEIISGFLRQAGEMTILISSHELDEVQRFATHVAFLHEGRLLFEGTLNALEEHTRPLFSAAFDGAAPRAPGRSTGRRPLRDIFVAMVRHARGAP